MCALSSCKPVVTSDWLTEAIRCRQSSLPLPSPSSFQPKVVDANIINTADGAAVSFAPNYTRTGLFQDRVFYFLSEKQVAMYKKPVVIHMCIYHFLCVISMHTVALTSTLTPPSIFHCYMYSSSSGSFLLYRLPHTLSPSHPLSLTPSLLHTLSPSHPLSRTPSLPHTLSPSHPLSLTLSLPPQYSRLKSCLLNTGASCQLISSPDSLALQTLSKEQSVVLAVDSDVMNQATPTENQWAQQVYTFLARYMYVRVPWCTLPIYIYMYIQPVACQINHAYSLLMSLKQAVQGCLIPP